MRYLSIGHICEDVTPTGKVLGGSVAFSALTARALGWDSAIVTKAKAELDLTSLSNIDVCRLCDKRTTTFENRYTPERGRTQILHETAGTLNAADIPKEWLGADIVHLAPIAREIDPKIISAFTRTFIGITPQGWMRQWDSRGIVSKCPLGETEEVLRRANATVLSIEDVEGDWNIIERWSKIVPVLAVTQGAKGATVFANGKSKQVAAEPAAEIDPTGAGDVFATTFFINLQRTGDPMQAAVVANRIAAFAVTRKGILGIPTDEEVRQIMGRQYDNSRRSEARN